MNGYGVCWQNLKNNLPKKKIKEARLLVSDFSVLATPTRAHFQCTDNTINAVRMYNE